MVLALGCAGLGGNPQNTERLADAEAVGPRSAWTKRRVYDTRLSALEFTVGGEQQLTQREYGLKQEAPTQEPLELHELECLDTLTRQSKAALLCIHSQVRAVPWCIILQMSTVILWSHVSH